MKMIGLKALAAVAAIVTWSTAANAASILTFDSVEPGDPSSWTLSCSNCDMLAFLDNDGDAYSTPPTFDLAGSLGVVGSAWFPVTGQPASRNPSLAGDAEETAFLEAIAIALGDTPIANSFQKSGNTTDPNTSPGSPTNAGDYFLWKGSQYAGVAKILSIGAGNTFSFSGSNGLSHIARISTEVAPVPLPATALLLLGGIGGLGAVRAARRRAA